MKFAPARVVKNAIARLILPRPTGDDRVGRIQLRRHQLDGVTRIIQSLDKYRGALLCDEVGLGKTFTAAAVMRRFSSCVVIAPAGLIAMWRDALQRAEISADLIASEKFSRTAVTARNVDLIVIDEAHHLRNPRTRRFGAVANYVGSSRLLLMTATPVHNRRSEIVTLISLFLGGGAKVLTPLEFSECVIRRRATRAGIFGLPRRVRITDECPGASETIRNQILNLPPPVPPRDGDYCATLVQFTLLRQWASSDAALRAGLESRIGKSRALISALESGTYPNRKELSAWLTGSADIQLGFPELLAAPGGDRELLGSVRQHEAATTELRRSLDLAESSDVWRVEYLRRLRAKYPERKIIAFTQFASTAHALFKRMRTDFKLAVITAGGCEIASGPVNRKYVTDRFAPIGSGVASPPQREEISMVLATDLCSEGLNLQDASVVVHLDTPWTPARLEQRVGRVVRPGGDHSEVMIHSLTTPDLADDLLRMADRLREKSALAAGIVGADEHEVLADSRVASLPEASERILVTLECWQEQSLPDHTRADLVVGFVSAERDCFIAVVRDAAKNVLISGDDTSVMNDPGKILVNIDSLLSADLDGDESVVPKTVSQINRWLEQWELERSLAPEGSEGLSRRRLTQRINQITASLPSHSRANVSLLADRARHAMTMHYNAAGEERIAELARSPARGHAWLNEISSIEESSHKEKAGSSRRSGFQLLALLIGRTFPGS